MQLENTVYQIITHEPTFERQGKNDRRKTVAEDFRTFTMPHVTHVCLANSEHHLTDLAQRMPGRDPSFQIDIAEQRPARLIRTAHRNPRQACPNEESCSQIVVHAGLFQQRAKPKAIQEAWRQLLIELYERTNLSKGPEDPHGCATMGHTV